jgi:N-acetylmuramoyl-L-alanine amidase
MKITKHKLSDDPNIDFKETPNTGGSFKSGFPDTIIIHYTAAPTLNSAVNWLTNSKAKASAHVVIGRDCKIVQLADFNTITWHAGKSSYKERENFNQCSIGIEIDNCGILSKVDAKTYRSGEKGPTFSKEDVLLSKHKNGGKVEAWHKYNEDQIHRVFELVELLCKTYKIKWILGHEDIAPGRKSDPGPAFPMDELNSKIFNSKPKSETVIPTEGLLIKDSPLLSSPDSKSNPIQKKISKDSKMKILELKNDFYKVIVNTTGYISKSHVSFDNSDSEIDGTVVTDNLNYRAKADAKSELIGLPLKKGTSFKLIENSHSWIFVEIKREGWISKLNIK